MIALQKLIESINSQDQTDLINSEIPQILSELNTFVESIQELSNKVIKTIKQRDYSKMIALNTKIMTTKSDIDSS